MNLYKVSGLLSYNTEKQLERIEESMISVKMPMPLMQALVFKVRRHKVIKIGKLERTHFGQQSW